MIVWRLYMPSILTFTTCIFMHSWQKLEPKVKIEVNRNSFRGIEQEGRIQKKKSMNTHKCINQLIHQIIFLKELHRTACLFKTHAIGGLGFEFAFFVTDQHLTSVLLYNKFILFRDDDIYILYKYQHQWYACREAKKMGFA